MSKPVISSAERRGLILLAIVLVVITAYLVGVRLSRPDFSDLCETDVVVSSSVATDSNSVALTGAKAESTDSLNKPNRKKRKHKSSPRKTFSQTDRNPLEEHPL